MKNSAIKIYTSNNGMVNFNRRMITTPQTTIQMLNMRLLCNWCMNALFGRRSYELKRWKIGIFMRRRRLVWYCWLLAEIMYSYFCGIFLLLSVSLIVLSVLLLFVIILLSYQCKGYKCALYVHVMPVGLISFIQGSWSSCTYIEDLTWVLITYRFYETSLL